MTHPIECAAAAMRRILKPGNVLASVGFLQGLACGGLTAAELDHEDDRYPVLITARAVRR